MLKRKRYHSLEARVSRYKPRYPQPHNIKVPEQENVLYADYLRYKAHSRLKYEAKYIRSKYPKRMY